MKIRTLTYPAILLAAIAPVSVALAAEGGAMERMTPEEAVERALRKNEGLIVERERFASADSSVTGARGAYDPLLQIDGGWRSVSAPVNSEFSGAPEARLAPTDESIGGGVSLRQLLPTGGEVTVRASAERATTDGAFALFSPVYHTGAGVEFRQPLLRGRQLDAARATIRVASAERDRAAASLRREVSETVAAVERAYWSLVAAREEVTVREEAVRLADEQLAETRVRIQTGAAPETEEAQPRAELERRRGELLAAIEAVSRVENSLKLLILDDEDSEGWSRPILPMDEREVTAVEPDVAAAVELALANRPELAAADAERERRSVEAQFARNEVRPSLDAVASYDRFGLSGSENPNATPIQDVPVTIPDRQLGGWGRSFSVLGDGDFDDARVGLVFSVPLRNRAARSAAFSAESAERQAEAALSRARKAVRAEVLDAVAALRAAYQRFEAARAQREAAEVQLVAERDRFEAGLSTNFLVLTRQNDLSRARLDELSARTDYHMAGTELARATGSLLDERGIAVEDLTSETNRFTGGARS